MKHLKKFNESEGLVEPGKITIYDVEIKSALPKQLEIYTNNGNFTLKLDEFTREIDILRVPYSQNTAAITGDVLSDAEPDTLELDIHFVKNEKGLKILVDVTYGDAMLSEFSIESPNKVSVIHYNGIGSVADPETSFGFSDQSLKELIMFFNRFGYKLTPKDFTFIDKYPDTFIQKESIKLTPISNNETILIVNNTKPQENRFLDNVIKYLKFRGINHVMASNPEEVVKMNQEHKIIGAISTGSDTRIKDNFKTPSEKALSILKCPIMGISYGMILMGKSESKTKEERLIHDHLNLTKFNSKHPLFKDVDLKTTQFSFSFYDYLTHCPDGFKVIAKLDDKIAAIANDSQKRYGVLFHPEDIERTYQILDNFIKMCHTGQDDLDSLQTGKFEHLNTFKMFIKK